MRERERDCPSFLQENLLFRFPFFSFLVAFLLFKGGGEKKNFRRVRKSESGRLWGRGRERKKREDRMGKKEKALEKRVKRIFLSLSTSSLFSLS